MQPEPISYFSQCRRSGFACQRLELGHLLRALQSGVCVFESQCVDVALLQETEPRLGVSDDLLRRQRPDLVGLKSRPKAYCFVALDAAESGKGLSASSSGP